MNLFSISANQSVPKWGWFRFSDIIFFLKYKRISPLSLHILWTSRFCSHLVLFHFLCFRILLQYCFPYLVGFCSSNSLSYLFLSCLVLSVWCFELFFVLVNAIFSPVYDNDYFGHSCIQEHYYFLLFMYCLFVNNFGRYFLYHSDFWLTSIFFLWHSVDF